ncbi:MAG: hypothetical protein HRU70_03330 [Phycisphaeraceae bacterium]|nr:MAG: hypothetical protein HRU70_03330 [Phycisphaeraceae bacterium]
MPEPLWSKRAAKGWRARAVPAGLIGLALASPGCALFALPAAMIQSAREVSTKTVRAEYEGLRGKSVAVVVACEPLIESQQPDLATHLATRITERLIAEENNTGVTGYVPSAEVLQYLYNHPGWAALTPKQLGEEFGGVDCIVWVEMIEFRLNDPGNQYTWSGNATGSVAVYDLTSAAANEAAFRTSVGVRFPDQPGLGPEDMSSVVVRSALAKRFIDRATWPFYDHEEPYYPKY